MVGKPLDVRLSANTVERYHPSQRVASHRRSSQRGYHTTVTEHLPLSHREYARWTPQRLVRWAEQFGSATAELVDIQVLLGHVDLGTTQIYTPVSEDRMAPDINLHPNHPNP